jgi:hypothetical protein
MQKCGDDSILHNGFGKIYSFPNVRALKHCSWRSFYREVYNCSHGLGRLANPTEYEHIPAQSLFPKRSLSMVPPSCGWVVGGQSSEFQHISIERPWESLYQVAFIFEILDPGPRTTPQCSMRRKSEAFAFTLLFHGSLQMRSQCNWEIPMSFTNLFWCCSTLWETMMTRSGG